MKELSYKKVSEEKLHPVFILQQFSNFFNAYTKAFNKQNKRMGKLFMEPFNRRPVTTSIDYTRLVHYIHVNPVHHGICKE